METLKDKAAIVGVGHTEYSRDSGRSEMSLAVEAIRNAIAAGAGVREVARITNMAHTSILSILRKGKTE